VNRRDNQLLRLFASSYDEAAFREIVERHVDLVYSIARRLVADPHLAEDVTQNVFQVLAQRAGAVSVKLENGTSLCGWLHLTTRNLATKMVRTEARRRAREREAALMNESIAPSETEHWEQIAPQLDYLLAQLPEASRDALLLRFFERRTAGEIGRELGISEEAAQKKWFEHWKL